MIQIKLDQSMSKVKGRISGVNTGIKRGMMKSKLKEEAVKPHW
jgi:hypothetical protein